MMNKDCKINCLCATCVLNPHYALNTPQPCPMADCDICDDLDCMCYVCSGYLSVESLKVRSEEND